MLAALYVKYTILQINSRYFYIIECPYFNNFQELCKYQNITDSWRKPHYSPSKVALTRMIEFQEKTVILHTTLYFTRFL